MDIGDWLLSLGLHRYEPAFRENDIEWGSLPRLTEDDLKDMGVVLSSHRRRLLDAIAALAAAQAAPRFTHPSTPAAVTTGAAERRQLTRSRRPRSQGLFHVSSGDGNGADQVERRSNRVALRPSRQPK